jgi:hypothetical protein
LAFKHTKKVEKWSFIRVDPVPDLDPVPDVRIRTSHPNLDSLKAAITAAWSSMTPDYVVVNDFVVVVVLRLWSMQEVPILKAEMY